MKKLSTLLAFTLLTLITLQPLSIFGDSGLTQPLTFKSKTELEKYLSSYKTQSNLKEKYSLNNPVRATSSPIEEASDSNTTNVQVEGVDEGDLLKNFENHLYYAQNGKINIVKTDQGKMTLQSEIKGQNLNYQELYVDQNRLVAISSQYVEKINGIETLIQIYDTTDLKSPRLYREVAIEGHLLQGRMIKDQLYIVNNKSIPFYRPLDNMTPSLLRDSNNPTQKEISATSVRYYPEILPESYTNILSMNINNLETISIESILGNSQEMYMNAQNLYITTSKYSDNKTATLISKYNLDGSKINFSKTSQVSGRLLDQFSMDEYNDHFRIATTTNSWNKEENSSNSSLFILDSNMSIIGKIENIAPEERIYSVRFQENKGYIVTFKEVDPLFTMDLSIPSNPKILGQLKVPGYSTYMHILPNNMVLGIGKDIQNMYIKDREGKEVNIGTREGGIKLSLFDVSDPFNPKEQDTLILGGSGSYSDALYNHKSLMVNSTKGDFGFCARLTSDISNSPAFNGAILVNTSNGKLTQKGTITENDVDSYYQNNSRLTYIDNYLYYINTEQISSYNYDTLTAIATMKL